MGNIETRYAENREGSGYENLENDDRPDSNRETPQELDIRIENELESLDNTLDSFNEALANFFTDTTGEQQSTGAFSLEAVKLVVESLKADVGKK